MLEDESATAWIFLTIVIKIILMIKYVKTVGLLHSTDKQEDKTTWALGLFISLS